jgi:hypothetical protein
VFSWVWIGSSGGAPTRQCRVFVLPNNRESSLVEEQTNAIPFVVCVTQAVWGGMMERLVNNEMEINWKEAVVAYSWYYPPLSCLFLRRFGRASSRSDDKPSRGYALHYKVSMSEIS